MKFTSNQNFERAQKELTSEEFEEWFCFTHGWMASKMTQEDLQGISKQIDEIKTRREKKD